MCFFFIAEILSLSLMWQLCITLTLLIYVKTVIQMDGNFICNSNAFFEWIYLYICKTLLKQMKVCVVLKYCLYSTHTHTHTHTHTRSSAFLALLRSVVILVGNHDWESVLIASTFDLMTFPEALSTYFVHHLIADIVETRLAFYQQFNLSCISEALFQTRQMKPIFEIWLKLK